MNTYMCVCCVYMMYSILCNIHIYTGASLVKNGKESAGFHIWQCGRPGFNPWVEKIPWRRAWQPTPIFLPGECIDRGAWQTTVHGITKSWTQLRD